MASDQLLTRDEVLGGLPARRAGTLLFLIESRTAYLVAQSRETLELFLTEELAKERERVFLDAFKLGQEPPHPPTIQDIERHSGLWAALVPANSSLRAALGHLLGQKYTLTSKAVPGIRAALGLDEGAVQQAYRRLYHVPLETLYTPRPTLVERLRWAWAALARRLESLSPFWTAFSLTLTGTIGVSILALPIAIAGVGLPAGLLLLLGFGLISLSTLAALAEALARHGALRHHRIFLGRVVADYLGHESSLLLSVVGIFHAFMMLLVYYIGAPSILADITPIPASVWAVGLFLCGMYFLSRQSLNATVASALFVAAVNIGLILLLVLLALPHVHLEYLSYVKMPVLSELPFGVSGLQLLSGTLLIVYYPHISMANAAGVVLRRDPSGWALLWGSGAALVTAMVIYGIWVVAIIGAVSPLALIGHRGTALALLAAQIGPVVQACGIVLVVLLFGMSSIHAAFGLFNLVNERLPTRSHQVVMLFRRQDRLLLRPRGTSAQSLRAGLTYLGLTEGVPQCRLDIQCDGRTHHIEVAVAQRWDAAALDGRRPELRQRGLDLTLEALHTVPEWMQLQVTSAMTLIYEGGWDTIGFSLTDVVMLPDTQRQLVNWMMRRGEVSLAQVAAYRREVEDEARRPLKLLIEQGLVRERQVQGVPYYRVRLRPKRRSQLAQDIWQTLEELDKRPVKTRPTTHQPGKRAIVRHFWQVTLSKRGRFVLSVTPIVLALLLTEWLLATGGASFSHLLGFLGVVTVSLVAGVFPILLLAASRRKGEYVPGVIFWVLGYPWVAICCYLFFLANLFLHGLVIWDNPVERAAALILGMLTLVLTLVMVGRGVFAPRLVVELRDDQRPPGGAVFALVAGGKPVLADVQLGYPHGEQCVQAATGDVPTFSALRYATFHLPATAARDLKVWVHTITPTGSSESLAASLEVHDGQETKEFDLTLTGGQVIIPLSSAAPWVKIVRPEAPMA
jgi:amino acid permease